MTEHDLRRRVTAYLAKQRPEVWSLKVHGSRHQRAGVPDLLLCWRGRMLANELKAPGGRLAPAQVRELIALHDAGAIVGSSDTFENFCFWLDEIRADHGNAVRRAEAYVAELRTNETRSTPIRYNGNID
jgi:hypothetical protein